MGKSIARETFGYGTGFALLRFRQPPKRGTAGKRFIPLIRDRHRRSFVIGVFVTHDILFPSAPGKADD